MASCPNFSSPEWLATLEKHNGNELAAFEEFRSIVDKSTGKNSLMKEFTTEAAMNEYIKAESIKIDPALIKKIEILENAQIILDKKLEKMRKSAQGSDNQALKEAAKSLEQALVDVKTFAKRDQKLALIRFIKQADKMTKSLESWIEKIKSGESKSDIATMKRASEYIKAFDLLDEIRDEYIEDEEGDAEIKNILSSVTRRKTKLEQDYLEMSRNALAKEWAPQFGKVEEHYKMMAEREFNTNILPTLKGTKEEKAKKKDEYVKGYLEDNAYKINRKTEQYIAGLLTKTEDVNAWLSWVVNPKDLGHDLISFAVEELDKADFKIMTSTREKAAQADRIHKEFIKEVGRKNNPKEQYDMFLEKDEEGNTTGRIISKDSDVREFYETAGPAAKAMFQFINNLQQENNRSLPKGMRLGKRLPFINKGTLERLADNGVIHTLKEGVADHFKLRSEDTEYGDIEGRIDNMKDSKTIEVTTNEEGKERRLIPLHYRASIEEQDRSYDVVTLLLLDHHNVMNFKEKQRVGAKLEMLKDVVEAAEVKQRAGIRGKLKIDKGYEKEVTNKGKSNLLGNIEDIIEHRIYGVQVSGDPNVAKKLQAVKNYTSFVGMATNYLSAGANLLHGGVMSIIETAGGKSGRFSAKNRVRGSKKYHQDLPRIVGDVGARTPKSKTNLLVEKFNAFSDLHAIDKSFAQNTSLKRVVDTSALFYLQSGSEHAVQGVVMYSILDNIKVKNKNGEFIDKDGNVVERDKAMSIDEAFSIGEDGRLTLHPDVAATDITEGVSTDDMFRISQIIRRTNRDLYGNYDNQNKSRAKRHFLGSLAYHMRGWLVPGFQKRWRGIAHVASKQEDLDLEQLHYNQETGEIEEGHYTTTLRFLWHLRKELAALKVMAVSEHWSKLTDMEKTNIKKAGLEAGIAVSLLLVAGALIANAEDGGDEEDWLMAFYARRVYSEVMSFADPRETLRTFRTPAIALNTVEDGLDLLSQSFHPLETYESGRRAGEYKILKKLMDLIPVLKQGGRQNREAVNFLVRD